MDAGTLRAWTRFAAKGGIGSATAMVDCPAAGADDLMFMAGEDIVVLRPLPGALTKGDPSGPFLGFCEGVVGRFDASQVRFHGRLKKPVVVRKQSAHALPHDPAPAEPITPHAPPPELRSPDEFVGHGFFSPPPAPDTLRLGNPPPPPSPGSRLPYSPHAVHHPQLDESDPDEDSALPWARSPSPSEQAIPSPRRDAGGVPGGGAGRHLRASAQSGASAYSRRSADAAHVSALSGLSGGSALSSAYSRSRRGSPGSAFQYLDQDEDGPHASRLSDGELDFPNPYQQPPPARAQQQRSQHVSGRGRRGSMGAAASRAVLAREPSDASTATTGTLSSSVHNDDPDDSASSPDVAHPSTSGGVSGGAPRVNGRTKKERDYTSIYDVYGRDSVAFPALAPWNHGSNAEPPASPSVPGKYLRDDAGGPGGRTPRGAAPLGQSPLGLPAFSTAIVSSDAVSSTTPSRNPSTAQSQATSATAPLSTMHPLPPSSQGGITPLSETTVAGLSLRQKGRGGLSPTRGVMPLPGPPPSPLGPRARPPQPHTIDTSPVPSPTPMTGNGFAPGQLLSPTGQGSQPFGLAPPSHSPITPNSAPPSMMRGSPLPSPGLHGPSSAARMPRLGPPPPAEPVRARAPPPASVGPVDEFGFFLPPGVARVGRIQENPSVVEAWRQIMNTMDVASARKSRKVKHMCRAGIPPSLRPRVWLFLANAQFRRQAGLFEHLCHQASTSKVARSRSADWSAIDKDSAELFADHVLFSAGPGQGGAADMAAVVKAYLLFNPAAGYSRGLGLVAGWLLIARIPPEDTFWLLAAILRHPTLAGYYDAPTKGKQLYTDAAVLARLLEGRVGKAAAQTLTSLGLDTFLFVPAWLDALYVRVLPWNTLARVWDAFLFEGPEWLLRVGVALTCTMAPALKSREAALAALRRPVTAVVGLVDDTLVPAAEAVKLKESEMRKLARNASKQVRKDLQHGGLDLERAQSH